MNSALLFEASLSCCKSYPKAFAGRPSVALKMLASARTNIPSACKINHIAMRRCHAPRRTREDACVTVFAAPRRSSAVGDNSNAEASGSNQAIVLRNPPPVIQLFKWITERTAAGWLWSALVRTVGTIIYYLDYARHLRNQQPSM